MAKPFSSICSSQTERVIAYWLLTVGFMVFIIIFIGGLTRLTHSGLSMVEWKPITGWLPPMDKESWHEQFDNYKKFAEYRVYNKGMTLEEFKNIFWLEFIHRFFGRLIGLIFLIPFIYFSFRQMIPRYLYPKLILMLCLGASQGFIGWWMVKSGLANEPDVSQYRLAIHLFVAFVILGYIFWVALGLLKPIVPIELDNNQKKLILHVKGIIILVVITILSGALVAGLDAGFVYNEFPLMDGRFFPEGYFELTPWYINVFENLASVQFDHRWLAIFTFFTCVSLFFRAGKMGTNGRVWVAICMLLFIIAIQVVLGISTLLLVVPISLASLHQLGAVMLFLSAIWTLKELYSSSKN
ncbi:MAG: Heme A synthase [Alphaproteobacteria bacterium MarineAlpha3_Bin5]|nr:heme A synthase [Magnetovibrio sp.]PPR77374.1 MAG: Heme A synthase [Alphaproteobacteria bacterium MarineAlpha3_Bin5]